MDNFMVIFMVIFMAISYAVSSSAQTYVGMIILPIKQSCSESWLSVLAINIMCRKMYSTSIAWNLCNNVQNRYYS